MPCKRILVLLFIVSTLHAQDIHFSQYFASPLSLNPANTGNFDGDFRVSGNYRSQWKEISKPYATASIGYDQQFYLFNERISAGIYFVDDKSAGTLKVNKLFLSAAYHKAIKGHQLHGGIQFGVTWKSISPPDETFPNQLNWSKGYFDNSLPNYETTLGDNLLYIDANLGFGWSKRFNKLTPHAALAFFHINYSKETFVSNGTNRIPWRKVFNGGLNYRFGQKFELGPDLLMMETRSASEVLVGCRAEYYLEANEVYVKNKSVFGGIYLRNGFTGLNDAGYAVVGMQYNNWRVGLSYDVNISPLHVATDYQGAFEISLIYIGRNTRLTKTEVPCDRY